MKIAQFFLSLRGAWLFNRTLTERTTGASLGTVQGKASFTPTTENELHYQEEGVFTPVTGHPTNINKEYIYRYDATQKVMEKYFANQGQRNGLFYRLNFNEDANTASGKHLCSQDHYQADYHINTSLTSFELSYTVQGPAKNYISKTIFTCHPERSEGPRN